jgi:hypothetical protein
MTRFGNGVSVSAPHLYRRDDYLQHNHRRSRSAELNQGGGNIYQAGWPKSSGNYTLTGFIPDARERDILAKMMAEGDPTNKLRRD